MRPVLIAGPTASGKSELALRIAERDGGRVINADALQVYDCWRVLTARPSAEDVARAPHALYGHVPCDMRYSVGAWLQHVRVEIDAARKVAERPVIVGGTGLYFSALTGGLADIPEILPEVRVRSAALIRSEGLSAMVAELGRLDPVTHGLIDLDNPVRVQRAWEVVSATGRGLADWQRAEAPATLNGPECILIVLEPKADRLINSIEARVVRMVEQGALDECRTNLRAGLPPTLPSMRALGAAPLIAHLRGETGLDVAIQSAVTATRKYAKRQRTWFRGRMKEWRPIDPAIGDPLSEVSVS